MIDSVKTLLGNKPEVGIVSTVGSWGVYYGELLNPALSLISLMLGCLIGTLTLMIKFKQWRK